MFFGYFDPENILLDIKLSNFRGDLTDISAKKEALRMALQATRSIAHNDLLFLQDVVLHLDNEPMMNV